MLFTEPIFFLFLSVVFFGYWLNPSHRGRKIWLLGASYVFYAGWDWRFCGLIVVSTLVDYLVGRVLEKPEPRPGRRFWLTVSICTNLGILGFFKYFDFFVTSAHSFLELLGVSVPLRTLNLVLPVGISFYTFQSMSYTIDVYWKKLKPVRGLPDFALFVAFFPQLVAGPILRARDFLPQLDAKRTIAAVNFRRCLLLFLVGFFKKTVISDNLAPYVDQVFADPGAFGALSHWIGTLLYAVQLYCDFSGYSDMAIAAAGLLGYRLMVNFNFPYFSPNLQELWLRWHISLSSFMRDYLFLPLATRRSSRFMIFLAVMTTMVLGGLWHGAGWNFVFWGALHGLGLVAVLETQRLVRGRYPSLRFLSVLAPLLTFYWFCLCLGVFRTTSAHDAWQVMRSLLFFGADGTQQLDAGLLGWFALLAAVHWVVWRTRIMTLAERVPAWGFAAGYAVAVALILPFVPVDYRPFIYFQF